MSVPAHGYTPFGEQHTEPEPHDSALSAVPAWGTPEPAGDERADTYAGRDDDNDEAGDEGPDDLGDEPGDAGSKKARKANNRPLIRRVAGKAVEIAEAPADQRAVLAAMLGVKDDVVTLTTAVMAGSTGSAQALADVESLVNAKSGAEAAIAVMTLGRTRMKAAWAVLAAIGGVHGALPASDAKAALEMVGAAEKLGSDAQGTLAAVSELAKRGW